MGGRSAATPVEGVEYSGGSLKSWCMTRCPMHTPAMVGVYVCPALPQMNASGKRPPFAPAWWLATTATS
jgi:hypothetical protein